MVDLNDLTETGWYFIATNSDAASNHAHVPRTDVHTRAYLIVLNNSEFGHTQQGILQLFLDVQVPCVYLRNAGENWTRLQPM